jgi:hypothetical protein
VLHLANTNFSISCTLIAELLGFLQSTQQELFGAVLMISVTRQNSILNQHIKINNMLKHLITFTHSETKASKTYLHLYETLCANASLCQ